MGRITVCDKCGHEFLDSFFGQKNDLHTVVFDGKDEVDLCSNCFSNFFGNAQEWLKKTQEKITDDFFKNDICYVYYMMEQGKEKRIKIGISSMPTQRAILLQTGNTNKIELLRAIKFVSRDYARKVERELHDIFKKKRIFIDGRKTEWFEEDVLQDLKSKWWEESQLYPLLNKGW